MTRPDAVSILKGSLKSAFGYYEADESVKPSIEKIADSISDAIEAYVEEKIDEHLSHRH